MRERHATTILVVESEPVIVRLAAASRVSGATSIRRGRGPSKSRWLDSALEWPEDEAVAEPK
jgi:hypothetical protein